MPTALAESMGCLIKLSLHSMKACVLPHIKTQLQTHVSTIRFLVLRFDNTDSMKTISKPWKYDLHDRSTKLSTTSSTMSRENLGIQLGGISHLADGLELRWFRELSDHCEVEVHSAAGRM